MSEGRRVMHLWRERMVGSGKGDGPPHLWFMCKNRREQRYTARYEHRRKISELSSTRKVFEEQP
jgi:hypothetical protein